MEERERALADLVNDGTKAAFRGKRVLVTGHTGFKGSWLTLLLHRLGAKVSGLALDPESPSLFEAAHVADRLELDARVDIRDAAKTSRAIADSNPDVVIHMAAQALVRRSFRDPVGTMATNVQGTIHVLEAIRALGRPMAVVVVTSDKVYANDGRMNAYSESDRLGGSDPYSASKAACELATASYRASFFPAASLENHGVALATARAGNVIGGGDWAEDRLVPDLVRAWTQGERVSIRSPSATRPWQHVLEPLTGYLTLASQLMTGDKDACQAWNFGPDPSDVWTVQALLECAQGQWPAVDWVAEPQPGAPKEQLRLAIDSSMARERLGWQPRWAADRAIAETMRWYRDHDAAPATAEQLVLRDIDAYGSGV